MRPADPRPRHRSVRLVLRGQPSPGGPHRSDCRRPARPGAVAERGRRGAEPDVDRAARVRCRSVQRQARSPLRPQRPDVRQVQHVRRPRPPAVRHQRAAGGAATGLRPHALDPDTQPGRQLHTDVRHRAAERDALRMDERRRRPGEPEPRRRLRAVRRAAGGHERPARYRLPAGRHGGALQRHGRPDDLRLPPQRALRALQQLPDRPRLAPHQVRGLLVPPAVPPRESGHGARPLSLHGPFQRQRVRRLPARLPDRGTLRHRRTRRRGRTDELAPPLRAGRLASHRQSDRQLRPALRAQPAHARRRQPPVDDRRVGAGWTVRHRERRRRQHLARRASVAAAHSDPVGDVGRDRVGPEPAPAEQDALRAAASDSLSRRTTTDGR